MYKKVNVTNTKFKKRGEVIKRKTSKHTGETIEYIHCPVCGEEDYLGERKKQTMVCHHCNNLYGVTKFKNHVRFYTAKEENHQRFVVRENGTVIYDKDTGEKVLTYKTFKNTPKGMWSVLEHVAKDVEELEKTK